jgi:catechol 2,3-dioxygenase-like lactoylglutathione lyase family enzyme
METVVARLLTLFEAGTITRRELIRGVAVAAAAMANPPGPAAQTTGFRTLNLDHLSCQVTDYARTRDFYAGLLGMTVANDNGKDSCEVHFGDARGVGVRERAMMSIHNAAPSSRTGIDHIALKVDNWDTDRMKAELERRGLKARLQQGGALDTPNYVSLTVQDPDGLGVQISGIARPGDTAYKQRPAE